MKKLYMAIALTGMLSAPLAQAAFDGTLSFGGSGPYQNGQGGEFDATATGFGNFITFCIEHNENIGLPSGPYNYRINSGAVKGGVSGATTTDVNTGFSMDNISLGTAWLYSQFAAGTLTQPDGTGSYFGASRFANAGALQDAIWYLEGEGGANNGYVTLASTAAGSLALAQADSLGAYGVVALNLFVGGDGTLENPGSVAQDQLAIIPEPTTVTAGALLLLPFAASAIRVIRKNRKEQV